MKCYESGIVGAFIGALMLCLIMLNFQAPKTCAVTVQHGNVSHITVGAYDE